MNDLNRTVTKTVIKAVALGIILWTVVLVAIWGISSLASG